MLRAAICCSWFLRSPFCFTYCKGNSILAACWSTRWPCSYGSRTAGRRKPECAMCADSDDVLIRQFEDCSLPLDHFRHSVHIRVAFLYLCKYSVLDVLGRFPAALARYAAAHGKAGLYHETITWAYILLIHERITRAGRAQSWAGFAAANADLMTWSGTILMQYYRDETLHSELARKIFLFPDKTPTPLFPRER